jgi:hypothetical protein
MSAGLLRQVESETQLSSPKAANLNRGPQRVDPRCSRRDLKIVDVSSPDWSECELAI